jgi:hypothetical protein
MALAAEAAEASAAASVAAERAAVDRVQASLRHRESPFRIEPRLGEGNAETPSPLRSVPKLGPAEKT